MCQKIVFFIGIITVKKYYYILKSSRGLRIYLQIIISKHIKRYEKQVFFIKFVFKINIEKQNACSEHSDDPHTRSIKEVEAVFSLDL